MSGGDMEMNFDQESMYFGGHCIEYDVIDMFQMLVDCALEPRSVLAANVARSKNNKTHALAEHLAKYDPNAGNKDLLLRTAYGYNSIGMPLNGLESNLNNVDARMLQQFIMDNVTPKKCTIVGSGIQNHKEFVDLVRERLGELLPVPEHMYERSASEYIGGEHRTWTESPNTNIIVGFEGAQWKSSDLAPLFVASSLIGTAGASGFSRSTAAVQNNNFVDTMSGFNHSFTDSGLFGVKIEGPGSHSKDLMNVAIEELGNLRNHISEEELNRTKNRLKVYINEMQQDQGVRLEEMAKTYNRFGDITFHKYGDMIDSVTADDINNVTTFANPLGCQKSSRRKTNRRSYRRSYQPCSIND
jgi:processing peptidase subunit alpha